MLEYNRCMVENDPKSPQEREPTPHGQLIFLQNQLGGGLTDFVLRDLDKADDQMRQTSRRIDRYIKKQEEPDEKTRQKINNAYFIVKIQVDIGETNIRPWWLGMNPDLDDQSPALVFPDDPEAVKEAAMGFVNNG